MSLEAMRQQYEEGGRSHATACAYINALEAENAQLRADIDYSGIEGAVQREERLKERITELKAENERLRHHQDWLRDDTLASQLDTINRQAGLWKAERKRAEKAEWMLDEALMDDHYSDRDDLERRWAKEGDAMTCPVCGKGTYDVRRYYISHLACVEKLEAELTAARGMAISDGILNKQAIAARKQAEAALAKERDKSHGLAVMMTHDRRAATFDIAKLEAENERLYDELLRKGSSATRRSD